MKSLALCLAIATVLLMPNAAQAAEPERPNVIVIILDDIPYLGDAFFRRLPNFKSIFIDDGINFQQADGNDPLCCPGRANILTGLESQHHGVVFNRATLFDPRVSIATELDQVGYYTGIFGKYFNGTEKLSDKTPPGWDSTAIMSGSYYEYTAWINGRSVYRGSRAADYSTDFFANKLSGFLASAPASQPLFAWFSPYATHSGKDELGLHDHKLPAVPPRHKSDPRCAGVPRFALPNFDEADVSDKPAWVRELPRVDSFYAGGYPLHKHCASLLSVDDAIGRVAATLKQQGRFQNTMWIAIGDNGWGGGSHRWIAKSAPYTTLTPLYVSWPAGAGVERRQVRFQVSNVDIAPTICEFAGCVMGPFPSGFEVDGQSIGGLIAPTISKSVPTRNAILMQNKGGAWQIPPWKAIKTTSAHPLGLWHYVEYSTGAKELYDVSGGPCFFWQPGNPGDPCELRNRAGDPATLSVRQALAEQMRAMW